MLKQILRVSIFFCMGAVITGMFFYFYMEKQAETAELRSEDVKISVKVDNFESIHEFASFHGNQYKFLPEGHVDFKNDVVFYIRWELVPDKQNRYSLYYPPYIIINPQNERWVFTGVNRSAPLSRGVSQDVSGEIIRNVLKDVPDVDWEKLSANSVEISAKSFGQGMLDIAYMNNSDQIPQTPEKFMGYFVYYDPVREKGWVKPFQFEVRPVLFD